MTFPSYLFGAASQSYLGCCLPGCSPHPLLPIKTKNKQKLKTLTLCNILCWFCALIATTPPQSLAGELKPHLKPLQTEAIWDHIWCRNPGIGKVRLHPAVAWVPWLSLLSFFPCFLGAVCRLQSLGVKGVWYMWKGTLGEIGIGHCGRGYGLQGLRAGRQINSHSRFLGIEWEICEKSQAQSLGKEIPFAFFSRPRAWPLSTYSSMVSPNIWDGKGIPRAMQIQILLVWQPTLKRGGNAISSHAEAQGVSLPLSLLLSLSFTHFPIWNPPLCFSFPLYSHSKVPSSLFISVPF